jgi:uncharacterized repeat protein (TIGR03803 family)
LLLLCATTPIALRAQTFTTLHSFDYTDGGRPEAGLVQATNGNLYGTTVYGGVDFIGTVFKITPSGTLTTLQSLGTNNSYPYAGLFQAANGNLYGTTSAEGTSSAGTVFKIGLSGTLTTLLSFDGTDGSVPYAGLVPATDGNFYGTTFYGGANNAGTVFKITPSGTLTTLYSFCPQGNCTDGADPYGGLVQGTDGDFYGTTYVGGSGYCLVSAPAEGCGTIFKITASGALTTLYRFCQQYGCPDGGLPFAGLVQATDGNLYGTTLWGGVGLSGSGTVFKITPTGTLTTLYSFPGINGYPFAGLVQATDGNLYGTTLYGGGSAACTVNGSVFGCGTVFKITPSGTLTTLHSFDSTDGAYAYAGLVQHTNGSLYGTTSQGGTSSACPGGCGTIFSLSMGLSPFVETQTTSGKVGAHVNILGTGLTGATSVTFNGTAAVFKVASASLITTTVPAGASTGSVNVTLPSGTLTSNQPFSVTPQITSFTPSSGPVGTSVTITGVSLTQSTTVTFGAVAATTFTVNSDTQVTTTVPTGAVTGKVGITTAGGTASSAASFTVKP